MWKQTLLANIKSPEEHRDQTRERQTTAYRPRTDSSSCCYSHRMQSMSGQVTSRVAWLLAGLALLLVTLGLVLEAANGPLRGPDDESWTLVALAVGLPVIGALVATHQPRNAIAWIFLGVGFASGLATFTYSYGLYAVVTNPGGLPFGIVAVWLGAWVWLLGFTPMVTFGLLLFPDGQLPSPRWRPILWAAIAALLLRLPSVFLPGPMGTRPAIPNPLGITGARPLLLLADGIGAGLFAIAAVGSAISLVVRFRRAQGKQREQLKWLAYAVAVLVATITISETTFPAAPAAAVVALAAVAFIPVAIGVAILRHQLFDIDRIINRTLVYGLLTALLGAVYMAGVFGLGQLLNPVTGESALAVAASTLAVAALFQPARRRIQTVVDQRFNRRKYNAAKTVEVFSLRLRDQVDLDTLSAELLGVVDQTMQPTTVSLWLSPLAHSVRRGEGQAL
jgi:hypothetical protein